MTSNKMIETDASVAEYIESLTDDQQRSDCEVLIQLMTEVVKKEPKIWGNSIVGFGKYHYRYESGREGDFFLSGFAPRKNNLSIHVIAGFSSFEKELEVLGKHKTTRSCLYVKTLDDIDVKVLKKIIRKSVADTRKTYS